MREVTNYNTIADIYQISNHLYNIDSKSIIILGDFIIGEYRSYIDKLILHL